MKQSVSESNFMAIKYVSDNIDKFVPEYSQILNDSGVKKLWMRVMKNLFNHLKN